MTTELLCTQDDESDKERGKEKLDRRSFVGGIIMLAGGLAGTIIASHKESVQQTVEIPPDQKTLIQRNLAASFGPLGYRVMIFDREGGGYNIHIKPGDMSMPKDLPNASSESAGFNDACFSKMASRILKVVEETNSEGTALTVYFDLQESNMTNRSIGVIERLKSKSVEIGSFVGGRELNEVNKLPDLPRLESVALPGISSDSVHIVLEKAPLVHNINTGTDEKVNLPPETVEMLKSLGRKSIRVNGEKINL